MGDASDDRVRNCRSSGARARDSSSRSIERPCASNSRTANLAYERERAIDVNYRGIPIPGQRVDLIVEGLIVVELKAVTELDEIHRAQVISYLRTIGPQRWIADQLSSATSERWTAADRPIPLTTNLFAGFAIFVHFVVKASEQRHESRRHRCVQRAELLPPSGFAPRPRPPTSRYVPWHAAQASDRSPVHSETAS